MKRTLTPVLALLAGLCHAQISDKEAIEEAAKYISAFFPEVLNDQPSVWRDQMEVRGGTMDYLQVSFGDTRVSLRSDGTFTSFSTLGPGLEPKGGAPDKYRTDEEAWDALDKALAVVDFDLPPGLERHSIKRKDDPDYVYTFYMRPRPYGYEGGGNYLEADIHRITGRLLCVVVARGWTYEPPNVGVPEAEAIAKAVATLGGDPSEWRTTVRYELADYNQAPVGYRPMI